MRVGAGPRGAGVEGGTLGELLTSVSEEFATLPRLGGMHRPPGGGASCGTSKQRKSSAGITDYFGVFVVTGRCAARCAIISDPKRNEKKNSVGKKTFFFFFFWQFFYSNIVATVQVLV